MSGPDWCRWYAGKWLTGTFGLSLEQKGMYDTVINVILDRGQCPDDMGYLARLCSCNRQRAARIVEELLAMGKLIREAGKLVQNRAQTERKVAENLAQRGADLASKRWKNNKMHDAGQQCQPQPQPESSSESHTNVVALSQPSLLDTQGGVGGVPTGPPDSRNGNGSLSHQPTKKQRGSRLPDDWALNDDGRSWCREVLGFSDPVINETEDEFRDWALSASGPHAVKLNWNRAFKNWARRKHERLRAETRREQQWRERFQTSRR